MFLKRNKISPEIAGDPALEAVAERYAVSVTDEVMAVAEQSPAVARQYLPDARELETTPGELADPIGDDAHSPVKGIVHRYPDRVLLKPVHVCAVYCRFCFRREKVGPGSETLKPDELQAALDYIRGAPQVWEVIVTGGDPFVLSPRRLGEIMSALGAIDHVKVIRFHSRVPVADPSRVTPDLIEALTSDKAVYVVVHVNHADELTENARAAARAFTRAGIPLLSQSVLLRGVNDDAAALEKLFRALVETKIKPYYLHHPDLAPGTSHFRLPLSKGRDIVRKLWGRLSGIAQPNYVLDIPGGHGKVRADAARVRESGAEYEIDDYQDITRRYRDE